MVQNGTESPLNIEQIVVQKGLVHNGRESPEDNTDMVQNDPEYPGNVTEYPNPKSKSEEMVQTDQESPETGLPKISKCRCWDTFLQRCQNCKEEITCIWPQETEMAGNELVQPVTEFPESVVVQSGPELPKLKVVQIATEFPSKLVQLAPEVLESVVHNGPEILDSETTSKVRTRKYEKNVKRNEITRDSQGNVKIMMVIDLGLMCSTRQSRLGQKVYNEFEADPGRNNLKKEKKEKIISTKTVAGNGPLKIETRLKPKFETKLLKLNDRKSEARMTTSVKEMIDAYERDRKSSSLLTPDKLKASRAGNIRKSSLSEISPGGKIKKSQTKIKTRKKFKIVGNMKQFLEDASPSGHKVRLNPSIFNPNAMQDSSRSVQPNQDKGNGPANNLRYVQTNQETGNRKNDRGYETK